MGLAKLLTVGRSLRQVRDQAHRYKLLTGSMPTFGREDGVGMGREPSALAGRVEAVIVRETAQVAKTMKTDASETSAKERSNRFLLARLSSKANPFKSSAKRVPPSECQGELSLDKVKVVRNDLSDSDLELVEAGQPARPAAPAGEPRNVFSGPAPDGARKRDSWLSWLMTKVVRARIQ